MATRVNAVFGLFAVPNHRTLFVNNRWIAAFAAPAVLAPPPPLSHVRLPSTSRTAPLSFLSSDSVVVIDEDISFNYNPVARTPSNVMASPTQTGLPPRFPSPASFPPAVPSQPPPPGRYRKSTVNHHLLVQLLQLPYTHLRPQPALHSSLGLTLTLPGRHSAAGLPVTWYQPPAVPSPSSPPHLKTPLPAAFLGNGDEDFPVWLTKFEVYADAHLYDATVRTRALPTFLDGPALTYFQSLPQETKHDYQHLCQALSHAFSQDKYIFSFQQSLAQRKRQPGESLIVFASELKHLVRRAHRTYNEAAIQGVTLQHFIQGIDSATRLRVIERNPSTIDQAVEIATLYEQAVAATTPRERSVNAVHRDDLQATVTTLTEQVSALTTLLQNHLSLTSGDSHRSASTSRPRSTSPYRSADTRSRSPYRSADTRSRSPYRSYSPYRASTPARSPSRPRDDRSRSPSQTDRRKRPPPDAAGRASVDSTQAPPTSPSNRPPPTSHISAILEGAATNTLIDTGSAISLISERLYNSIPHLRSRPLVKQFTPAQSVTGQVLDTIGVIDLHIHLGDCDTVHPVHVVRDADHYAILGWDFCIAQHVVLDAASGTLTIGGQTLPLLTSSQLLPSVCHASVCRTTLVPPRSIMTIPVLLTPGLATRAIPNDYTGLLEPRAYEDKGFAIARTVATVNDTKTICEVINTSDEPVTLKEAMPLGSFLPIADDDIAEPDPSAATTLPNIDTTHLSPAESRQLTDLLERYNDVFSCHSGDRGRTSLAQHRIITHDSQPIKQRPHRMPVHRQAEVQRQVNEMLDAGVVEPSQSPWASPVVLVRKKNGTHRFCVDYRKLNHATVKDAHPLPRTDDTIDALSGSAFFTTLDMTAGYWQVPIHPDDREKTAFTTGRGLFQFTVMPFGLTNAPSTFQRLMELLLAGLDWRSCLAYLDDIILFSRTFEDHLAVLEEVLSRFRSANLKLNADKCKFAQPEVNFLGHVVSRHGVQPDPTNTDKVRNWPTPTSTAHVRSFLGLASYYRKFIRHFAKITEPLNLLTRKGNPFSWSIECQTAFDTLRDALTSPPVLAYPDFSRPFTLHTDASDAAIGAVLSQTTDQGEQVVAYASRTLSSQERRWATFDREMWAVVWSVRHFRTYLAGRRFMILTDHKPLLGWSDKLTTNDPTGRRSRWALELSTYEFDMTYRAGKAHTNADALSRLPPSVASVDQPPISSAKHSSARPPTPRGEPSDTAVPVDQPPPVEQHSVQQSNPPDASPPPPPTDSADDAVSPDNVRLAQEADRDIAEVLRWKQRRQGKPPLSSISQRGRFLKALWDQYHSLVVKRGVLYRRWKPNANCQMIFQRVAPKSLVPSIMRELHNGPFAGHLGIAKTLRRVYVRFYWPGMTQEIKRWCRACPECATRTAPTPSARAPLKPIRTNQPFEKVAMDLTELPKSKKGNRYCLVLQDFFTKYVNAYAIPRQDASTVAQAIFTHYVREHGIPSSLHSDQGRQFEAETMRELYTTLGIAKSRTTPYHPQGDGLVERFNRTLKSMLSKYVSSTGDDWDDHLPHILLAYNTSVHASTGYTPFYLVHGREANLPADVIFDARPHTPTNSTTSYARSLKSSLRAAFARVRQNTQRASSRQKAAYDFTSSHKPYKAGDKVWLNDPTTQRRKLRPRWKGPFVVVERILSDGEPGVTYTIKNTQTNRKQTVHYNRLKPCYTRQAEPVARTPTAQPDRDCPDEQTSQPATATTDTTQRATRRGRRVTRPSRLADYVTEL
ncbi:hypothetical protein Bbelb_146400 [Branchiostoma belcheri]|nr:hypothetical protein Bbelb_146400 [Branchiostoma belcheri]